MIGIVLTTISKSHRREELRAIQGDPNHRSIMQKLKDTGLENNTIVVFTTDNGAENFSWPDGGQTPFAGGKGTVLEGGFRVPCILRWSCTGRQGGKRHYVRARLVSNVRRRGRRSEHR